MKVLLKVGYDCYLLPDDKGITTVMKALSRAVRVTDHTYCERGITVDEEKTIKVEVSYVSPGTKITRPKRCDPDEETEQLTLPAPESIIIPPYDR
jgi:hypothetical protein